MTYPLPEPFLVIATQNPIETQGTFPLPEAQLDRFLMRLTPGYPDHEEAMRILDRFRRDEPMKHLAAGLRLEELKEAQSALPLCEVEESVRGYIVALCEQTRRDERAQLGASPRGMLALMRASQALALIQGRAFVVPDDVQRLAEPVLAHRIIARGYARPAARPSRSCRTRCRPCPCPRKAADMTYLLIVAVFFLLAACRPRAGLVRPARVFLSAAAFPGGRLRGRSRGDDRRGDPQPRAFFSALGAGGDAHPALLRLPYPGRGGDPGRAFPQARVHADALFPGDPPPPVMLTQRGHYAPAAGLCDRGRPAGHAPLTPGMWTPRRRSTSIPGCCRDQDGAALLPRPGRAERHALDPAGPLPGQRHPRLPRRGPGAGHPLGRHGAGGVPPGQDPRLHRRPAPDGADQRPEERKPVGRPDGLRAGADRVRHFPGGHPVPGRPAPRAGGRLCRQHAAGRRRRIFLPGNVPDPRPSTYCPLS